MDNALIRQKDFIIDLINSGDYAAAITLLKFVKELWHECSYGYKWRELRERGIMATNAVDGVCRHWKQIEIMGKWQNQFKAV